MGTELMLGEHRWRGNMGWGTHDEGAQRMGEYKGGKEEQWRWELAGWGKKMSEIRRTHGTQLCFLVSLRSTCTHVLTHGVQMVFSGIKQFDPPWRCRRHNDAS